MPLIRSLIESANAPDTDFPLNNLPYGVFSLPNENKRMGVAIGDKIIDLPKLVENGHLSHANLIPNGHSNPFLQESWNDFMALGPGFWRFFREALTKSLSEGSDPSHIEEALVPMAEAKLHMPFRVSEFTDFYASRNHATNVGTMFRGAENALPPNWLHIPIGYNGRASSVVVDGTDVIRPHGQLKGPDQDVPSFLPSRRFDFELEMGAIVGVPSDGPISLDDAMANIFGYVILNDWSARDIQAWEYQPLGPFQAKATATTISPWIVTAAALEPFRVDTPEREFDLLDHLKDTGPMLYDIDLEVAIAPEGKDETVITRTNYREMYYSSAQQLTHHTSSGCPMRVGDLLGSGTISGPSKESRGALLELSWGGKEPLSLDTGETRSFIEDGDTITMRGAAKGDGYRIGFGKCAGKVIPARS
ncbi:fumarylacetoacetase [Loktanella sp. 1ANDIMAR09]|nr:fumarylacetoacetase [Loktanella sp. 1ANDIMAR09]